MTCALTGTQVRHEGGRPALVSHRLKLHCSSGPDIGESWEVMSPSVIIGTALGCDVKLTDRMVSRQHCEILVRDQRYVLRDLRSTNGTFVNDAEVIEGVLEPGAHVRIGETELVFQPKKKWVRLKESSQPRFGGLVGGSPLMRALFGVLERVAPTRLSCVILGETGTGKELAARAMHQASPRASGPFVVVDCAAVSSSLIEAELFGHERGAFTSADRARPGAFELAHGGTLFLDEVGELPLELQPKLLRVLERREVKRLGQAQPIDVDVRVICATHRPLLTMVRERTFRDDLYYRLAEVVLEIAPLRDRQEDVPLLVAHMLEEQRCQGQVMREFLPEALHALQGRSWPGNVRELRNVVRRAAALAGGERVGVSDLGLGLDGAPESVPARRDLDSVAVPIPAANRGETSGVAPVEAERAHHGGSDRELWERVALLPIKSARELWNQRFEREYLLRLMQRYGDDEQRAAAGAGVHIKSLQRLLRQHGLRSS